MHPKMQSDGYGCYAKNKKRIQNQKFQSFLAHRVRHLTKRKSGLRELVKSG